MDKTNDTGKLLGAVLLGAIVGGALGILLAPDKGSNTRQKIADKGDDFAQTMKKQFTDLFETIRKEMETLKSHPPVFTGNGKVKTEQIQ